MNPTTAPPKRLFQWLPILILLLLASQVIVTLNEQSIWGDEGWSIRFTAGDSLSDVTQEMAEDRHPPLYFVMLYVWRHIVGDDEVSMRMLSVFTTLLAAAMLYRWARLLLPVAAALAVMLVFALLDQNALFAQEVRHYELWVLWVVMASYGFFVYLQKPHMSTRLGLIIVLVAGMYTHLLFALLMLAQALYLFFVMRRYRDTLLIYGAVTLAYLPWLPVIWYQYGHTGGDTPGLTLTWENVGIIGSHFLGYPLVMSVGLLLLGILSPLLKLEAWREAPPQRHAILYPLLLMALPMLLVLILSADGGTFLNDRYLVMLLPALAWFIGIGAVTFRGVARLALLAFIVLNGVLTTDIDYHSPPWRPLSRTLSELAVPGQPIFRHVGGADAALEYHLHQEIGDDFPQYSIYQYTLREEIAGAAFDPLTQIRFSDLAGVSGFWMVQWSSNNTYREAFPVWGYVPTATRQDVHFGAPITAYRFDSVSIMERTQATFDGRLRLHAVAQSHPLEDGEPHVMLWWSTLEPLDFNYVISVFWLNPATQLVAQHDAPPSENPMTAWQPDSLQFDTHPLTLPQADWRLAVKVYDPRDGRILLTEDGQEFVVVSLPDVVP